MRTRSKDDASSNYAIDSSRILQKNLVQTTTTTTGRTKVLSRSYRQTIVSLIFCLHFFLSSSPSLSSSQSKYSKSTFFAEDDPIKVYSPPKNSSITVAICLIVKNETVYLDEWVDYHISLGFAPIFIYDNMLYPDWELQTWYARREDIHNYVTIIHFPQSPIQMAAYNQCLRHDAKNSTFAGLFDVDEFLVLRKNDNVVDFVEEHCNEECGQLGINWRVMSSSLERRYRPVPITKRNVQATNLDFHDISVKVIVRPSYVVDDDMDWTHTVRLKKGFWIDTNRTIVERPDKVEDHWRGKQSHKGPTDIAQFYHYRWKSEEEYRYKTCKRGNSLKEHGDFPHCGGRVEKIGMFNAENECGSFDGYAKLLLNRVVSKCGVYDNTAWRHLKRMVPKYAKYDQEVRGEDG